jgi:TPR repeat protein
MWKKLITSVIGLLAFTFAQADLFKAENYAKKGYIDKAHYELYLISQRAMDGNPKAMCEFGTMYMRDGYWIIQSDEDASQWWLKSAEMGYAQCQFYIGTAYLIGSGVDKDLSQAKYWLKKAIGSTYDKYSRFAKVLYAANELDNH